MYKVVIIEDDAELAQTLATVIGNEAPFFEIMGIAPSIAEGEKLIAKVNPDVAFFDIELADGLSFDLLERLPSIRFEIIFVTAFSHYALNAFKYSAIDFVTKPIDPDDIRRASKRAVESLSKKDIEERIKNLLFNRKNDEKEHRIVLQTAGSMHLVKVNEIIRCESDINYTTFYIEGAKPIVVSKTMGEFEKLLPSYFFRAHRSHLINLNYVVEVNKRNGMAILANNEKIEVSVRRKEEFIKALKEFCCP